MKKILLLLLLCVFADDVNAQLTKQKESIDRGIWLRVNATGGDEIRIEQRMKSAIRIINDQNTANSNANPWVGVNLQLTWGQLHNGTNYNIGVKRIKNILNLAETGNVFVQLSIADKYQSTVTGCECGDSSTCDDDYYLGPTPNFNNNPDNTKALNHIDFNLFTNGGDPNNPVSCDANGNKNYYEGYHVSDYRYARQQFKDKDDGRFLRKYFSIRWNNDIENEWLRFWRVLGREIGNHPALHSIITPESSNSFSGRAINNEILLNKTDVNPNNIFKYPGGAAYVNYLEKISLELRKIFPANVLIINNTNWIYPNVKSNGKFYQEDIANKYLTQNETLRNTNKKVTVGWCAQDIVLPNSKVDGYYSRGVYEQMMRFPKRLRFGLITGETELTSDYPINTPAEKEIPGKVLEKINEFGLANLIFISNKSFKEYESLISQANLGDFPFMPDAKPTPPPAQTIKTYYITNKATGGRLKLKSNQREITTTDSNNTYNDAKWDMVLDKDNRFGDDAFQLFNKKTRELIRYNNNAGGAYAGRVIKDADTTIKYKTSFWRKIPAKVKGYFYLENLGSGKLLAHDLRKDPVLHQTNFRGKKTEWFFELVSNTSKLTDDKAISNASDIILIYPNPVLNTLHINTNVVSKTSIYSINGQLVKSYPENQTTIDVSTLNKGVYFLKTDHSINKFVKQ
ncbi:T9SS type A sorting domain-containing protein [uncultured Algibacter sp.]|uniref:T9SS type A sorting domain-containing protein n=1 Tax=uncultured Algibacter sp. TaxID=298659 RepID=UPI0032179BDC